MLTVALSSRNRNLIARTQNSMVDDADRRLAALVDANTGGKIPDFPRTAAVLNRMSSVAVNQVLLALRVDLDGGLEERRNRLREAIGLRVGGF